MEDPRSKVAPFGLIREALEGISRRPSRSLVAIVGSALGIGAFVSVLGLTATANSQIAETFTDLAATELLVQHAPVGEVTSFSQARQRAIASLNGVRGVARKWDLSAFGVSRLPDEVRTSEGQNFRVTAASPSFWSLSIPSMVWGRVFDDTLSQLPVAVLGEQVAIDLGIPANQKSPLVHIGGKPFAVIGVVSSARRDEVTATSVVVPDAYSKRNLAGPGSSDALFVVVDRGAGAQVAAEIPVAVNPFIPSVVEVQFAPPPRILANSVTRNLQQLFIVLASVSVLVAAVGIVNINLFSVLERVPEIGLRRSVGALRKHVLIQFLYESAILSGLGGIVGGLFGELVVLGVSLFRDWTPTIVPWTLYLAPPAGVVIGLIAGAYPAYRASKVEPVEAFRR